MNYLEKTKEKIINFFRHPYVRAFLVIYLFGLVIFLPATLTNYFALPMNGDYVLQQVPFYENAHDIYWHFFRTGEFTLYSYENFLGVNYYPANTFYYLTSPFVIFMIICPKFLMPQLLYFSMVFKMSFGGFFFFILLKKYFKVNQKTAFIGGLVYAFSGWGMFYLWFNHLADVMAIFPLTLIGAEHLIKTKKGGLLSFSLLLMGMTNYFFLFTFALTNPFYIFFRVLQEKRGQGVKVKVNLIAKGALYFVIGIALSGFILLPAYSLITNNPRLDSFNYLTTILKHFFPNITRVDGNYVFGSPSYLSAIFALDHLGSTIGSLFDVTKIFTNVGRFCLMILVVAVPLSLPLLGKKVKKDWQQKALLYGAPSLTFFLAILLFFLSERTNPNFLNFSYSNILALFNSDNIASLGKTLFRFSELKHFLSAFASFFFPVWGNYDTILYSADYFDNVWSSMYITMPLIALMVPSLISSIKKKKILDIFIFIILVVMPLTPISYYLLHAFSLAYGRWQIFPMAMALIYAITKLDKIDSLTKFEVICGFTVTITLMTIAIYLSYSHDYMDDFRLFGALAVLGYSFLTFAFYFLKDKNKYFSSALVYIIMADLFINATMASQIHGYQNYQDLYGGLAGYRQQTSLINQIQKEDPSFYRIFNIGADRSNNNLPMAIGYKGLSTFHSVYEYNLTEFNNFAKLNYSYNNWSMGVHEKRFALESFLNVKYYLVNNIRKTNHTYQNLPHDFIERYCTVAGDYCIYENPDHYELGSSFTNFISEEDFSFSRSDDQGRRTLYHDQTYLKAPVVKPDDVAEIAAALSLDPIQTLRGATYSNSIASVPSSDEVLSSISPTIPAGHELKITRYIWEAQAYREPEIVQGFPSEYNFNYNDKIDMILPFTIPADSLINVNVLFGPNMAITLYAKEEHLRARLLEEDLTAFERSKLETTLEYDCSEDRGNNYCQVTYDSHMTHWYRKSGDHKNSRGFYSPLPIDRIQLKFQENSDLIRRMPTVSYASYQQYRDHLKNLKDNSFDNIEHTNNQVHFTTNYPESRLVLLSIPFNDGWTVKINGEAVKTYQLTSGFLGFIAPAGEATYDISFFTPALSTGLKLTGLGVLALGGLLLFEERRRFFALFKKYWKKEEK